MPKVTNFAFCEQTSIDENNPRAINYLQVIQTSSESFSFSILFSVTDFSANEDHTGYVTFSDPNDNTLIETEKFFLEKEDKFKDKANLVTGVSMGVEFEVPFEGQGLYTLRLFFDDEKLGEFFIPVLFEKGSDE